MCINSIFSDSYAICSPVVGRPASGPLFILWITLGGVFALFTMSFWSLSKDRVIRGTFGMICLFPVAGIKGHY